MPNEYLDYAVVLTHSQEIVVDLESFLLQHALPGFGLIAGEIVTA